MGIASRCTSDNHHALCLKSPWLLSAFWAMWHPFAHLVTILLYSAVFSADRNLLVKWSAPVSLVSTLLAACPPVECLVLSWLSSLVDGLLTSW